MSDNAKRLKIEAIIDENFGREIDAPEKLAQEAANQNCADSVALGEFEVWSDDFYDCWLSTYGSVLEEINQ